MKHQLFDTIPIKVEHTEAIDSLVDNVETAKIAFLHASRELKENQKLLFEGIDEMYPDLKDYHYSIDNKKLTIKVLGRIGFNEYCNRSSNYRGNWSFS